MNSTIEVLISPDQILNDCPVVYFKKSYLKNQKHEQFIGYQSSSLFLLLTIEGNAAISIPRSPFGSFFVKDTIQQDEFLKFVDFLKKDLKSRGVESLDLRSPPAIYSTFIGNEMLEKAGFEAQYHDLNQHVELDSEWKNGIHTMQKRKLEALRKEGFEFRKMGLDQLKMGHDFIAVARQTQGLQINISYELLKQLADETESYDVFGVFRDEKISALCICVRVTEKIAYYFLPATSPMFRNQSPMVLLIAGMVQFYFEQGFSYFDLGVSSIEGKPQETLKIFKERMNAVTGPKTTWKLRF